MNWLKMLFSLFQVTPLVVAGIEHIHGEASGATKKQMAMDALGLATGVATAVIPGQSAAISAASKLASDVIDGVVATFNAAGVFAHKGSQPSAAVTASQTQVHPAGGN